MTGAKPEPGELMPVAQSPQLAPAGAALLETVLNGAPSDSDTPAPAAEGSDATRAKTRAAFELADTTGLAAAPHLVEAMMEQGAAIATLAAQAVMVVATRQVAVVPVLGPADRR